jgi:hypothetical protein
MSGRRSSRLLMDYYAHPQTKNKHNVSGRVRVGFGSGSGFMALVAWLACHHAIGIRL